MKDEIRLSIIDKDGLGMADFWINFCEQYDLRTWNEAYAHLRDRYNVYVERKTYLVFATNEDKLWFMIKYI